MMNRECFRMLDSQEKVMQHKVSAAKMNFNQFNRRI